MWTSVCRSVVGCSLAVALLAGLGWPAKSHAQPCSGVPNPVVVAGTPAAEPLVQQVAKLLQSGRAESDPNPLTVVWQLTSSCGGIEALALDTKDSSCATGACITGKAKFWTQDWQDSAPKTCNLEATGTKVDLALSDVFPATCPGFGGNQPAGLLDWRGPVTPYALVMAKQAIEQAMHAEEAHFVFGTGKSAGVKPWLNDAKIFVFGDRDAGQLLLGSRIKLGPGKWKGTQVASPDDLILGLLTDPPSAVGILPTPLAELRRNDVRTLAFQALGQHGAFFPDRKATSFDKQNVRDGHYPLWGFLHAVLREDPIQAGNPKSQNGARLAKILLAQAQVGKDKQEVLPMQVAAGFVPQCAMRVTRTSDAGVLTPYNNTEPCHCWFEKNVTNGLLGCMECPSGTCAVGTCRRKFCEVQ